MAYAKRQKFILLQGFQRLWRAHKIAFCAAALAILVAVSWLIYAQPQTTSKFSKANFDQLASRAGTVLTRTTNSQSYENKTCSYESPEELGHIRLFCTLQGVSFTPYRDAANALSKARLLEQNIDLLFGRQNQGLANFDEHPFNGYGIEFVHLGETYNNKSCNFFLDTNRYAQQPVQFLPARKDNNLIAVSFECKAESQGEYFPVTYRQGS
jgi:hypothetical protein